MIEFIKSNSNIFIFIFLVLLTVDGFLLIIKYRNYLESLPNLKISYDISKSYCLDFCVDKYKLVLVKLTIENISTKPIDITNIKLINDSKSYLAVLPKVEDNCNENRLSFMNKYESEFININVLSENIIKDTKGTKNMSIPLHGNLSGYAVFEDVEPIINAKNYRIIVETPSKVFEKEITINPLNN